MIFETKLLWLGRLYGRFWCDTIGPFSHENALVLSVEAINHSRHTRKSCFTHPETQSNECGGQEKDSEFWLYESSLLRGV